MTWLKTNSVCTLRMIIQSTYGIGLLKSFRFIHQSQCKSNKHLPIFLKGYYVLARNSLSELSLELRVKGMKHYSVSFKLSKLTRITVNVGIMDDKYSFSSIAIIHFLSDDLKCLMHGPCKNQIIILQIILRQQGCFHYQGCWLWWQGEQFFWWIVLLFILSRTQETHFIVEDVDIAILISRDTNNKVWMIFFLAAKHLYSITNLIVH